MAPIQPVILDVRSTTNFFEYVLHKHIAPSTIVYCGTRAQLLSHLQEDVDDQHHDYLDTLQTERPIAHETASFEIRNPRSLRFAPTLRLLSSSRSIKVVFCPDVAHLRAYLAIYSVRILDRAKPSHPSTTRGVPTLAILNFINLHRETSAFSAQGFNRTFSIAVEAAYHSHSKLIIAECTRRRALDDHDLVPSDPPNSPTDSESIPAIPNTDTWDEAVSILNVATKTFGAGARGWVGRTVPIRTIAQRWFAFESLVEHS